MAYDFNADEVFRIAEQIEKNGAHLYGSIAEKMDGDIRRFFLDLSSMEKQHEKVFASMRAGLSDTDRKSDTFDPAQESLGYLKVLADSGVFDARAREAFAAIEGKSGVEGMTAALKAALDIEKESVVFYLGMRDLVPDRLGRDKLESILKEEMKHIRLLGGKLMSVRA